MICLHMLQLNHIAGCIVRKRYVTVHSQHG